MRNRFFQYSTVCLFSGFLLACNDEKPKVESEEAKQPSTTVCRTYDNDPMQVRHCTLKNKLQVFLTENHEKPQFYAEIAVRAGGKHDPEYSTGMAHYLEHMLFKGSTNLGTADYAAEKPHLDEIQALYESYFHESDAKKREEIYASISKASEAASRYAIPQELDSLYTTMGGQKLNAHTSYEETIYKVQLPSNQLARWASVEGDRFQHAVFRLFQTELETVYEEKNRSLDNPGSQMWDAFMAGMFKSHPYGQQTILGSAEHLKNPSLKEMYKFYHKYYVPNNMAIILSGDFDSDEALALIEKAFGQWEEKPIQAKSFKTEEPLQGREQIDLHIKSEPEVLLGFRTVNVADEDKAAVLMMDMILDNAQAGLINIDLIQAQKVKYAGAFHSFFEDYGLEGFYGVPKDNQTLEKVEALLLGQVDKIKAGEFDAELIPAVANHFRKMQEAGLESNESRVKVLRKNYIEGLPYEKQIKWADTLAAVTKEDVMRVAKKYLGDDFVAVYRHNETREGDKQEEHLVKPPKPELGEIQSNAQDHSVFYQSVLASQAEQIPPKFVDFKKDFVKRELQLGVWLRAVKNPINEVFTLEYKFDHGVNHDKSLQLVFDMMPLSGTENQSAADIQKALYGLGASVEFKAGKNHSVIKIEGLDRQFVPTLNLVSDWVRNVKFQPENFKQLINIIKQSRRDILNQKDVVFSAIQEYARYQSNSSFIDVITNKDLESKSVGDLYLSLEQLWGYQYNVDYVGTKPVEDITPLVMTIDRADDREKENTLPPKYRRVADVEAPTAYFYHFAGLDQTNVSMNFGSDNYRRDEHVKYQLFNSAFGHGMNSLLFKKIREENSFAYRVSGGFILGSARDDQNYFTSFMGVQNDKFIDAMTVFHDLYPPVKITDEFESKYNIAKAAQEIKYRAAHFGFREILPAVDRWERREFYNVDPRQARLQELPGITFLDLKSFTMDKTDGTALITAVVADKEAFTKNVQASAEGFEEKPDWFVALENAKIVSRDDIFGYWK